MFVLTVWCSQKFMIYQTSFLIYYTGAARGAVFIIAPPLPLAVRKPSTSLPALGLPTVSSASAPVSRSGCSASAPVGLAGPVAAVCKFSSACSPGPLSVFAGASLHQNWA